MRTITCDHCGLTAPVNHIDGEPNDSFHSAVEINNFTHTITLQNLDLCPDCYKRLMEKCRRFIDECYQKHQVRVENSEIIEI